MYFLIGFFLFVYYKIDCFWKYIDLRMYVLCNININFVKMIMLVIFYDINCLILDRWVGRWYFFLVKLIVYFVFLKIEGFEIYFFKIVKKKYVMKNFECIVLEKFVVVNVIYLFMVVLKLYFFF